MTETSFNFDLSAMTIRAVNKSVPTLKIGDDVWFRGNDCAEVLGYKKPNKAVTDHVDEEWRLPLSELLKKGTPNSGGVALHDKNALGALWINQSGLIEFCTACKLPIGRAFKKWVFGEVLPTIFRTGSYSINKPQEHANATPWQQARVDGIELFKLKNATLHELLTDIGVCPKNAQKLYAIVGCAVNQGVLDTNLTKKQLFKKKQLPNHMSIPDFLDFDGHLSRQFIERAFQGFVQDNMERLKGQSIKDTEKELDEFGGTMREAVKSTGYYTNLIDKMMTLEEAKTQKRNLGKGRSAGHIKASAAIASLKASGGVKKPKQASLKGIMRSS